MPSQIKLLIVFAITGLVWLFMKPPSGVSIQKKMVIQDASIAYKGVDYLVDWQAETVEHSGDVHELKAEYNKYAPINTHHVVLTSGDYSDPEKVDIAPLCKGHTSWRAKAQPTGSMKVLHLIPANEKVFKQLKKVKSGQSLTFMGQEEQDNQIPSSKGGGFSGGSKDYGHYIFFVHEIKPYSGE